MRTTVELPPELMRTAKARAAEQGESLKAWLTRAVAKALGERPSPAQAPPWPVFGKPAGRPVRITSDDIASVEAAEDLDKHRRGIKRAR